MNELIPGERIITSSANKKVTLTSHRICYNDRIWGRAFEQQIMLDQVSSCEHYYKARVWLIVVGGLVFLGGLSAALQGNTALLLPTLCFAMVCLVIYLATRYRALTIGSSSIKMRINMTGLMDEEVQRFMMMLHRAKNEYRQELQV